MLLGFVSVVGVLFGYFVRKSVRELTEDVRHDVEAQVKLFEQQKQLVIDQAKVAQQAADSTLKHVEKLADGLRQRRSRYQFDPTHRWTDEGRRDVW